MTKKIKQLKTNIELRGSGVTINCTIISEEDKKQYLLLKEDANDALDDLILEFLDKAQITVTGLQNDQCSVWVNDSDWNDIEGFDDILRNFELHSYPLNQLIQIPDGQYCFMQIEYERGTWFKQELAESFDEKKLQFKCVLYELPNGDEYALLTAIYDGRDFDYFDPVVKGVDYSIINELAETIG